MKTIRTMFLLIALFLLFVPPMQVRADMGPKPSVVIEFVGLEDEMYYVTLLSEEDSTGPWSHGNEYYDYMGDEAVFQKFNEYEDEDGYYFLSYMEDCSEDDCFEWGYYPPKRFKILLYFPEYSIFMHDDEVYERYAFDSYFTVTVDDVEEIVSHGENVEVAEAAGAKESANTAEINDTGENTDTVSAVVVDRKSKAEPSYDFSGEIFSLVVRVILTIAIEILIAVIFAYRDKKALTILVVINIITQVILNILLNVINYRSGELAFILHYVWMEFLVFVIEGILYAILLAKNNPKTGKKRHPILYAAVANMVSFLGGLWLALLIPGMF